MKQGFSEYYEANLSLLKKHHFHVWEMMTSQDVMPVGEIFYSSKGKINLKVVAADGKVFFLHDSTDPEAEVPLFLDMVGKSSMGVVALIGIGLGYTPLALLRERRNIRHLAVFEADPGMFLQALNHMDLSSMLSDPRLILNIGKEPVVEKLLAPAARALKLEPIHMLQHMPSFALDNSAYEKLYDLVFGHANQLNIGAATTFRFGLDFINNRFTHLTSIHHNCLLESLQGKFSGIPAIMVAGGPSLDKNIHLLEQAKGTAVILAADTVLPVLLNRGITPDFVTCIDPQEMTYEKFADVVPGIKDISLICSAWVHPKVPKLFPADQIFWSFSGNSIEKWLNNLMGGSILTGGAGTVAHMNMIAAIIMGCSPIVFIGQDLAYTGAKDHAGDVFLTSQKQMDNLLNSKDVLWVDGIDGTKVPSSRAFLNFKDIFERMILNNSGHYVNATEGGAHIEGTQVLSLMEVLDLYCSESNTVSSKVEKQVGNAGNIDPKAFFAEFESVMKTGMRLRKVIKKADGLSRSVQHELKKYGNSRGRYKSFDALSKSMQKKIVEIDSYHKKIDKEINIWKLLEDITMEGLRQSERMLQESGLVKDDPARYLDWLSLNLKRLDLINRVRMEVLDVFEDNIGRVLDFHEIEKKMINEIKEQDGNERALTELVRHYFETGNYRLAVRLMEKHDAIMPDSPEINFFSGAIAALQADYDKSDLYFRKILDGDGRFLDQVAEFRQKMGDKYLKFSGSSAGERNTAIKLLLKGLRHCLDHEIIQRKLVSFFIEDLKKIQVYLETNTIAKIAPIIELWQAPLQDNPQLPVILNTDRTAEFYKYKGDLLTLQGDLSGAAESFGKALEYTPDNPDLHVLMTDVLFGQNKFDEGVEHLNSAVSLDRNYAKYWENVGDNTQKWGQFGDAIPAYEQCLAAMPENIGVLKKIGDCYQLMEQYEAAAKVYKIFENLSEKQ